MSSEDIENENLETIHLSLHTTDIIVNNNKNGKIQKMAEEHQLTHVGNRLYCHRCNKHVSISVRNIKRHLNEELHENNAEFFRRHSDQNKKIKNDEGNLEKMPISKFVKFIAAAEYVHATDVVINNKYSINQFAFMFLIETIPNQLWCYVCEENVRLEDLKDHLYLKRHDVLVKVAPILIRADSEFIREIGPGKYHCGYCNILEPWEAMEKHFESADHKENKELAIWRLTINLIDIENQDKKYKREHYGDFAVDTFFN